MVRGLLPRGSGGDDEAIGHPDRVVKRRGERGVVVERPAGVCLIMAEDRRAPGEAAWSMLHQARCTTEGDEFGGAIDRAAEAYLDLGGATRRPEFVLGDGQADPEGAIAPGPIGQERQGIDRDPQGCMVAQGEPAQRTIGRLVEGRGEEVVREDDGGGAVLERHGEDAEAARQQPGGV